MVIAKAMYNIRSIHYNFSKAVLCSGKGIFALAIVVPFLIRYIFVWGPGSQVPSLVPQENIDSNLILLREEYAWHIGGAVPQHELDEWKLLYHSSVHGLSFSTFLGNISWVAFFLSSLISFSFGVLRYFYILF